MQKDAECADHSAQRVGEAQELVGEGPQICFGIVDPARDDPARPTVSTLEVGQDSVSGVEDPGALVRVRIEHDGYQREGGHEVPEGAGFALEWRQFEIEIGSHEGKS